MPDRRANFSLPQPPADTIGGRLRFIANSGKGFAHVAALHRAHGTGLAGAGAAPLSPESSLFPPILSEIAELAGFSPVIHKSVRSADLWQAAENRQEFDIARMR